MPKRLYRIEIAEDGRPTPAPAPVRGITDNRFYLTENRMHGKLDIDYVRRDLAAGGPISTVWFDTAEGALAAWVKEARRAVVTARARVAECEAGFAHLGLNPDGDPVFAAGPAAKPDKKKARKPARTR